MVNQKFMVSLSFWSWLVEKGLLPDGSFIQPAPHILFTHGADGAAWLRQRVEKLYQLCALLGVWAEASGRIATAAQRRAALQMSLEVGAECALGPTQSLLLQ